MRNIFWATCLLFLFSQTATAQLKKKKNKPSLQPPTTLLASTDTTLLGELRENVLDNIPIISLDENDLGDASSQNVLSTLTGGRDPFYSAAAFNFNAVRFKIRGYDADNFGTYMNGIPMENLDNGFTPYGLWGGLNDVMRNKDQSYSLRPNTFSYGDIGSNVNIDSRASKQRKQTEFGYAFSNRAYTHRFSFTHNTGISKKGWAFSFSGSRRWAEEGYAAGTYYNGYSYFLGVDKRFGQKHLLSLVAFGAPTENGKQGAIFSESAALAGTNYYNPYWGYQNGKKRNANVGRTNQPYFILTHDFRFSNKSNLVTAIGYSFGERGSTRIDFYNARDPRPDYYRYLPSYENDPVQAALIANEFKNNTNVSQINWGRLYDDNRSNIETINGVTGHRSRYVLQEDVVNTRKININSVFNSTLNNHVDITAGISYQSQNNNYYKKANDLLGGDFFVDLNQFAERTYSTNPLVNQNDLNRPNRIIRVGDRYGYDYDIHINKAATFIQGVFKFNKVDFFIASELSSTQFWRVGNVKSGLFPNNSFGKSTVNNFYNYAVKGGITYKLDGRNYFFVNGSVLTKAPFFDNAYISARTRDNLQDNITSENIQTIEAGYVLNAPKLKVRLNGYYAQFTNGLNVITFYNDLYTNFSNIALSNINKIHFGGEFGFEAKIAPNLTMNGAAAVGRYYYNSRQNAITTLDNDNSILSSDTVYSQNYRVGGTPQEAYSIGFSYRSPKFWSVNLTGNYFDQLWLDINPLRRTYAAVKDVPYKGDLWNQILAQQQLDAQYTIDLFASYSWKLPRSLGFKKATFMIFNLGISNLSNNKNIRSGGYEQLRFDFADKNVNKFPPKYFYSYGANYFASVTVRF